MYTNELPLRVRVLILGGGIHGVGILHDMASRGWRDIHLVERASLGSGNSDCRELLHGGVSHFRSLSDLSLFRESAREQKRLIELVPDLITPYEFLLPIPKSNIGSGFWIRSCLLAYDKICGPHKIHSHRTIKLNELVEKAPIIDPSLVANAYSFWDALIDIKQLGIRIAAAAKKLGCGITERTEVIRLQPSDDGWDVYVRCSNGLEKTISALYVVNALGVDANELLDRSGIKPTHRVMNIRLAQLKLPEFGLKSGVLLPLNLKDRPINVVPGPGFTCISQRQDLYTLSGNQIVSDEKNSNNLIEKINKFIVQPIKPESIQRYFSVISCSGVEHRSGLNEASRISVIGERRGRRGVLFTLYGAEMTSYRILAKTIGDKITEHFGEFRKSQTDDKKFWQS